MGLFSNIVFFVTVAAVTACDYQVNVDCSSRDYKYAVCPVAGAAGRDGIITVVSKYSKSSCTLGNSYGLLGGSVWVDKGCRAKFNVCFCNNYTVVNCESIKYRYKECQVPGASAVTYVDLNSQRSKSSCNGRYGITGRSIYVKSGCRGTFHVCYQ